MTRVAVFSDSHHDQFSLGRLLDQMGEIDAACFLGDVASDAAYLRLRLAELPGKPPLYAVRGNNDIASALPDELVCEIGGKRLYLTHGHLCASLYSLVMKAKERGADAALFGHTHEAMNEYAEGVLLLNPGAAGDRMHGRGGAARASLLVIDRGSMIMRNFVL